MAHTATQITVITCRVKPRQLLRAKILRHILFYVIAIPKFISHTGTYLRQLLSKLVEFLLQWGPLRISGGHLIPNLPNLCLHPCRHDNTNGSPCCNVGTLGKGHDRNNFNNIWPSRLISVIFSTYFVMICIFCMLLCTAYIELIFKDFSVCWFPPLL